MFARPPISRLSEAGRRQAPGAPASLSACGLGLNARYDDLGSDIKARSVRARAVNLQRDRDRRSALRPVAGCPTRLVLAYEHREALAKMVKDRAKGSVTDFVGWLVEQARGGKITRKRKARAKQPTLDL
jgi:hypothetical protein